MKKTIKQWMMPVFGLAVGVSFVAAEAYAAKESVDLTGRARGWYQNGSSKDNKDAKSVSKAEFVADGRIGVTVSTTQGDWTGAAMAEIGSHDGGRNNNGTGPVGYRDAWAEISNKQFALRMGRQWMGDYCMDVIEPLGGNSAYCVGGLLGRTQGLNVSLQGLPVSLGIGYVAVTKDFEPLKKDKAHTEADEADKKVASDLSGFNAKVQATAMNATISFIFETSSQKGNKDRGGNDKRKSDGSRLGLVASYPINNITVSGGFDSNSTKSNTGEANAVDEKVDVTTIMLGGNFDLGDGMGVSAYFDLAGTKNSPSGGTATKQDVTSYTLAFQKSFASTNLTVGYTGSSTKADNKDGKVFQNSDGDSTDGASSSGFAFGLASNF